MPTKKAPPPRTPLLEWIAAAIGLVVVLATLALVSSEALRADTSPPAVMVQNLGARRTEAGWVLQVRADNRGGSPAAQVRVTGELTPPGGMMETAEATFDFVPDHSARDGGLFFSSDPAHGKLVLRATGYADP
jgi:uncharacterized protein (TIGR02588 family)